MLHVVIRSTDKRVVSFSFMEENISTEWIFDQNDDFDYQMIVLNDFEFEDGYDLTDYRWDEENHELILDPEEPDPIEYTDLETGEKVTMTSDDFNNLVDERVRNNVEAIITEMIEANKLDLIIPQTT